MKSPNGFPGLTSVAADSHWPVGWTIGFASGRAKRWRNRGIPSQQDGIGDNEPPSGSRTVDRSTETFVRVLGICVTHQRASV